MEPEVRSQMAWRSMVTVPIFVVRALRAGFRQMGVVRTLRLAGYEVGFDLIRGTKTSNLSGGLQTRYAGRLVRYEGTNPLIFRELLAKVPLTFSESVFLDYGCGSGRALLLAANFGFKKVVGVESSRELLKIANRNVEIIRQVRDECEYHLFCCDAAEFIVPSDVNVAYFFNPFGPEVLAPVILNLRRSLEQHPRELWVVYLFPRFSSFFVNSGFTCVHDRGREGVILRYAGPK